MKTILGVQCVLTGAGTTRMQVWFVDRLDFLRMVRCSPSHNYCECILTIHCLSIAAPNVRVLVNHMKLIITSVVI